MDKLKRLIKPNILYLEPYSSARDEYQDSEGIFLDANENPYELAYNRYPDPYQRLLKTKISEWRNVPTGNIFLGNGSDEVIDLLIRSTCTIGKDRILSLDPSYGMYKVSAAINDIAIDLVAMDENLDVDSESLFAILNDSHKLIFICSPNNPSGAMVDTELIERILASTDSLVVVDEAYIDFSDSGSWVERLDKYEHLVVLQTFSKSLGAAGIRVGMGFMNPFLVGILNKVKPPYNISTSNQEVAAKRLLEIEKVEILVKKIKSDRESMKAELEALAIVDKVFPSQANFLLVRFYNHRKVYKTLLGEGVIIRDRSSNTNCEDCLRFSIGTEVQNSKLLEVLKGIK